MGAPRAHALAAAYQEYAWTHLRWVPRISRAALHLDLFEQPGHKQGSHRLVIDDRQEYRTEIGDNL